MDPDHEITAGELYRRSDGKVVTVIEAVGNAINYRVQGATLLERPSEFWTRKAEFIETMEGPLR